MHTISCSKKNTISAITGILFAALLILTLFSACGNETQETDASRDTEATRAPETEAASETEAVQWEPIEFEADLEALGISEEDAAFLKDYLETFWNEPSECPEDVRADAAVRENWVKIREQDPSFQLTNRFVVHETYFDDGQHLVLAVREGNHPVTANIPDSIVSFLILLERQDGTMRVLRHILEYGEDTKEFAELVRGYALSLHGPVTEEELEEGKEAAVAYLKARLRSLGGASEETIERISGILTVSYDPELYDARMPDIVGPNGMLRPMPYFLVKVSFPASEEDPQGVVNYMSSQGNMRERVLFVRKNADDIWTVETITNSNETIEQEHVPEFTRILKEMETAGNGTLFYSIRDDEGVLFDDERLVLTEKKLSSFRALVASIHCFENYGSSVTYERKEPASVAIRNEDDTWTIIFRRYGGAMLKTDGEAIPFGVYTDAKDDMLFDTLLDILN